MNPFTKLNTAQVILLGGCLLASAQAMAAPMTFSQIPPGAGAREPAPNVIVSVDDSGSMGSTGMTTLRQALRDTFGSSSNLAENRIRMAWQSMNQCPSLGTSSTACGTYNGMRYLGGTHRTNFDAWVNSLVHNGGTPGHLMMDNAGQYLSAAISNVNSPWAANPGTTQAPILSCRKNYHIFMTDGGWNSGTSDTSQHIDTSRTNNGTRIVRGGGNADNTTKVLPLPSGRTYDVTSNQTRLYRDNWGGATTTANGNQTTLSTLADISFHYWSTDLQTGLANDVRPTNNRTTPETFVATNGTSTTLDPFWNPRNNPATWQNMVTYTIGFNTAAAWAGDPSWGTDTFSGDLPNLINGVNTWVSPFCAGSNSGTGNRPCDGSTGYTSAGASPRLDGRRMDLWHAALNGRGRFVPAPNSQALVDAFQGILSDILSQTAKPLVSIASNSTRLARNGLAYVASYNSERWSGDIKAYRIDDDSGLPSTTETWKVSTQLDSTDTGVFSHTNRVVLTHNGTIGTGFLWNNLSTAQKNLLSTTSTDGTARINYLRGDRSKEVPATGGTMRQRDSRLGDIVNSNLWYVGKPVRLDTDYPGHAGFRSSYASRTPVLYVGANDGMLHGFNANTGKEVLAYVPRGVYANLRDYTLPSYTHKYFVDGNPFAGDADLDESTSGTNWRTVLVGPLGAGGKGYFVLDVTNPTTFTDPGASASSVVLMDKTEGVDSDVGHIFATPSLDNQTGSLSQQIVKLNNGRWAAIMGNGYNSSNERPVLLIQYLDGTRALKKIIADSTNAQTNGLGAPATFDVNGNGTVDVVYAGDLKGNMWKFNLVSTSDSDWGVSTWSGSGNTCDNATTCVPFFVAKTSGGATRPITAAPALMIHPQGGLQVIFGTGKDLEASDRGATTPPTETIFSVWDLSTYKIVSAKLVAEETGAITVSNGRSRLVEQTVTGSGSSGVIETTSNAIEYSRTDSSAKRGWYFDLPVSDERLLIAPRVFDANTLLFGTIAPKKAIEGETCDLSSAQDKGFLTFLNAISGAPPKNSVFGDEMDPSGNASRLAYGSGEFITLVGPGSTTFIPPTFACDGNDCEQSPNDTCIGPTCASCTGPDCPDTTCVGADCRCTGKLCRCVGPDCDCEGACGGAGSGGFKCGLVADLLDACRSGRFGARTDWRELR